MQHSFYVHSGHGVNENSANLSILSIKEYILAVSLLRREKHFVLSKPHGSDYANIGLNKKVFMCKDNLCKFFERGSECSYQQ